MLFLDSNLSIVYFTKAYMRAFLIEFSVTVSKMLSYILCKNALLKNSTFLKSIMKESNFPEISEDKDIITLK